MRRRDLEHIIRAAADIADVVQAPVLVERLALMPIDAAAKERIGRRIAFDARAGG